MNTHSITYIRARRDDIVTGWKVKGSTWSTLACPWLIAHDLFHHAPDDKGTVADELQTIGAEFYVNFEEPGMLDIPPEQHATDSSYALAVRGLATSASGVVGMPFDEGVATPESYVLKLDDGAVRLSPTLEHLLERCAQSAVDTLEEHVANDEDWAHARISFNVQSVSAAMRDGYLRARQCFPDREAVCAAFEDAMMQISEHSKAPEGTELTVTRQGLTISITEVTP